MSVDTLDLVGLWQGLIDAVIVIVVCSLLYFLTDGRAWCLGMASLGTVLLLDGYLVLRCGWFWLEKVSGPIRR